MAEGKYDDWKNPYASPSSQVNALALDAAALDQQSRPASREKRLVASVIDNLVLLGPVLLVLIALLVMALRESSNMTAYLTLGFLTLASVSALIVYQVWLAVTTGQTIGKKHQGIRVVRMDGSQATIGNYLLRNMVPLVMEAIPLIGTLLGLADALFIFREDSRCIHDHIGGTKVIDATSEKS